MTTLQVTALDGGQVALSGPDVPPTAAGSTSIAVLAVGNRLHEFTAGDLRFSRVQALDLKVTERSTYRMHGGTVRIGTGEEAPPEGGVLSYMHVAWEGRGHTVATVMYHGDTSDALALLDAVEIDEQANGIALRPRDARISVLQGNQHAPAVVVPVPGAGLLHASRASRYWDAMRPAWAGKRARGGDLYAEQRGGHHHGDPTMLLFGRNAVTRVHVNDTTNGLANRAADLVVDWV